MLPRNHPDRIGVSFDSNAGLGHPRPSPVGNSNHLGASRRGGPTRGTLTLVASALAGGDCIDDADALRAGGTILGGTQGAIHPGHLPAQRSTSVNWTG